MRKSFVAIIMMALHPRLAGYSPVRPYTENNGDAHQKCRLLNLCGLLTPSSIYQFLRPLCLRPLSSLLGDLFALPVRAQTLLGDIDPVSPI
jgi:hypothetical protein